MGLSRCAAAGEQDAGVALASGACGRTCVAQAASGGVHHHLVAFHTTTFSFFNVFVSSECDCAAHVA